MPKIYLSGDVSAIDPGIVNTSSTSASIDIADVTPDLNLKTLLADWWQSDVAGKIGPLYFVELRENGALFRYCQREIFVEYNKFIEVDNVGLSYAYGSLYVSVKNDE